MPRVSAKPEEEGLAPTTYSGVLRRFTDGTWGAVCFELGLITRGPTEQDTLRQLRELIEFEVECIREGDPPTPATMELLADFMASDIEETSQEEYVSAPFLTRCFRLADPTRRRGRAHARERQATRHRREWRT